jgi:leucyl aminopeptidase
MKITIAAKHKKEAVTVRLVDAKDTRFIEREDGSQELRIGIGERGEVTRRKLIIMARRTVAEAKTHKAKKVNLYFEDFVFPQLRDVFSTEGLAELLAREWEMAHYEFHRYKTEPTDGWNAVEEITLVVNGGNEAAIKKGIASGQLVGKEVNEVRNLSNTPGGDLTPKDVTAHVKKAVQGTGVKVTILGRKELEKQGFGAVLGVAAGSPEEPQFIVMEHRGGGAKDRPIIFAGKGVTFDSGGLNLKPSDHIYEMHMDMSGGAAVIHAVIAAAKLKLKKNVIGLIPTVENMPSGSSYRPGDLLRSLSGKTIEVLNTDAEGRVILADALTYAKRFNPRLVVSVATLTGASLIALGEQASAIMTRNQDMENLLRELGEESGDYVWPFPLWEEYEDMVKGRFGDVPNIPAEGNSRYAGVIGGGMFLLQFTKDYPNDCPFVHIDMAPRMTAAKGEFLARGAAGAPLRLLLRLVERY